MNFVDYCIATKNFSALDAVEDYTKSFGIAESLKGLKNKVMDATGLTKLNRMRNTLKKRAGMSDSDILKGLFNKKDRALMKTKINMVRDAARNRNQFRKDSRELNQLFKDDYAANNVRNVEDKRRMQAFNDIVSGKSSSNKDIDAALEFINPKTSRDVYESMLRKSGVVGDKKIHQAIHGKPTDED